MDPVKCDLCGKEFKNDLAVKIHKGLAHGKRKARVGRKAKVSKPAAAAPASKSAVTCDICGRSFKMAAHLARHKAASHKTAARTPTRKVVRRRTAVKVAAPRVGVDVAALSVDKLIALKTEVDARLAEIVAMMRKANVKV